MSNEQKTLKKDELAYWIGFNHLEIGPGTFFKLLEFFGTAKIAWLAEKKRLEKLSPKLAEKIVAGRARIDCEKLLVEIQKAEINILTIKDKVYPANLAQIVEAPYILYFAGEIEPQDANAIAVVGARKATSYGREVTETLVTTLVAAGLTIVSGLARGIDSIAHKAAIDAQGRTIAVLGSGIDVIYPAENKNLYQKIIQNGAVISEFAPATPPKKENFPVRNRIIAGLSLGVLVTEAAAKSGSLITAGFAADFGREVFAVPGPVYSKMSEGTANLIKDGAKLVYKVADILEELRIETKLPRQGIRKEREEDAVKGAILEFLQDGPKQVDQIIRQLSLPTQQISSTLTILEITGKIKNLGAGVYAARIKT